ncbi:hypothetical protein KCP78_05910 [Salmonella enterica subsp. enterica]|nr:hypothetical protein KCP78_05910 [Salmonella enterica subsp. enterica]
MRVVHLATAAGALIGWWRNGRGVKAQWAERGGRNWRFKVDDWQHPLWLCRNKEIRARFSAGQRVVL